jgi:hypothetical protein
MSVLLFSIKNQFFPILIFLIQICDFSTETAKEWVYGFLLIFLSIPEKYSYFCQDVIIDFGKSLIKFISQANFIIIFVIFALLFLTVWFINKAIRR